MNQTFNFKRYLLLLKRQWFENAAIYKWGIVLMVAATSLLFWLFTNWKTAENPHLVQKIAFSIVGILFIFIYGSNFFESLSSKYRGMFYFSLPVSPLERIAVAFTYVMVLLPFIFLIIFSVSDFLFVQLFNHVHDASEQMYFMKTLSLKHIKLPLVFSITWSFLSFTSIYTLGSLVFGKNGMIISMIITTIIIFIIFCVISWLWIIIYGPISTYGPKLITDFIIFFASYIYPLIIPLCWGMMYYCMKRKEV